MARRKQAAIADDLLDRLRAGAEANSDFHLPRPGPRPNVATLGHAQRSDARSGANP